MGILRSIFRRLRGSLRRRSNQDSSTSAMNDAQSELADDDSSWLEPPPGYEEEESACTCSSASDTRGSAESGPTVFEEETALTSATVTGPIDSPAIVPQGMSSGLSKSIKTNDVRVDRREP